VEPAHDEVSWQVRTAAQIEAGREDDEPLLTLQAQVHGFVPAVAISFLRCLRVWNA
jgi:hypothetical protein